MRRIRISGVFLIKISRTRLCSSGPRKVACRHKTHQVLEEQEQDEGRTGASATGGESSGKNRRIIARKVHPITRGV